MKKADAVVVKETKYIFSCVLILSVLMQAVFLIIGRWDYTVLLGNILSGAFSVLNFFLMGLTVQNALCKEEKEARSAMKVSQMYRNLMMLVVLVCGILVPLFNNWTVIIPVFFPRIAVMVRHLFDKDINGGGE